MRKRVSKRMVDLVCKLEYLIGSNCYNPNSYDGWSGEEGCSYRYPVYINESKDVEVKTRNEIYDADYNNVYTLKYKFGSNHLYIGEGIIDVLEELESRYKLDFDELEKKRSNREINNKIKELKKIYSIIEEGNTDFIDCYYEIDEIKEMLDEEYDSLDYIRDNEEDNKDEIEELNRKCYSLYKASDKLETVIDFIDEEKNEECILIELKKSNRSFRKILIRAKEESRFEFLPFI